MRVDLIIDGTTSEVSNLHIAFNRQINEDGKVVTRVQRGLISITKDAIFDKGSMVRWMADQDTPKEGTIKIYRDDRRSDEFQKVEFKNGKIFDWHMDFDREGVSSVYETFSISAEIMVVDGAEFDFEWPENQ